MYNKVDSKLDFLGNEEKVAKFWKENDIPKKALELNKNSGKEFVLHDGPPTANGKPHIGHVLTRAMKDIIPRFKSMQGYYVYRKAGWDTHGLPVEVEIEKNLGFSGKKDIENYGIDKFIKLCRESVWKYKDMWEDLTNRIAYWVDMEHPYITYSNDFIESEFWAFKQLYEKGLISRGHKVVPYCPRCGTSLSKAELENGDNYKILKENSVYVKMKSLEEKDTYFIVWTTTPWTLPSNVAICLNPNENYVKLEYDGAFYIVMEKLVSTLFKEDEINIVYTKKGKEFEYHKYEPLFDYVKGKVKNAYFAVVDDYVTSEDGTGIVHIAPAFGADDAEVGNKYNLDFLQFVDEYGKLTDETEFAGMFIKDADKYVINKLKEEGKMFKVQPFEHSYPHCWRCKSPLLYYAQDVWYLLTTKVRDKMVSNNQKVNWKPEHIKNGRMGNWLENNIDWCISRNRYWGTPLPFWVCECGHVHVVGSVEELKNLSGITGEIDLHKPTLYKITFPCDKCGKTMHRTPEVCDCWFDSGSMPFAQHHYPFENKTLFEKTYQADYISEAIDQTRGWFYTLQAVGSSLFGKTPYKAVNTLGLILDRNGLKMSKSLKNGIDPWDVLNKYGADGVRWYFFSSCLPGQPTAFKEENLVDLQRKFMGTLWNVYAFYVLYAEIDKFNSFKYDFNKCKFSFLDKWLLSEYNALIKKVTTALENYDMLTSSHEIASFVDNLSNWYVRRSRDRYWGSEETDDKVSAYMTLYHVLVGLSKLCAPFVPYISESIYQNLVRSLDESAPLSVHFCAYPVADEKYIDESLNLGMNKVLDIVVLGRSARNTSGVKNRQPLSKAYFCTSEKLELSDELKALICDELNVESIEILHDANEYVSYEIKPQLRTVGPKYGKFLGKIQESLKNIDGNLVVSNLNNGKNLTLNLDGQDVELSKEDLLIAVKNKEGYSSSSDGNITVVLDTNLSEELLAKGIVREIISKIQNLRKSSGFDVCDHIKIGYIGDSYLENIIAENVGDIASNALANSVERGAKFEFSTEVKIDEKVLTVYIEKV